MRKLLLTVIALVSIPVGVSVAYAVDVITDYPFGVTCTSNGQVCSPPFSVNASTLGVLRAQYLVSPGHCSSVRAQFFLDNIPMALSPFLGYAGDPQNRPMQTLVYDLGPVAAGTHLVSIQGEGEPGGCNAGNVATWGGTLRITTSEGQVPVEPITWSGVKARFR